MNEYREMEIHLHSLLISALDVGEWPASCSEHYIKKKADHMAAQWNMDLSNTSHQEFMYPCG